MVTDTDRSGTLPGMYTKVLPRSPLRSSRPASAPSVQALIIALILQQVFEGWSGRTLPLQLQLHVQHGQQAGELGEAHLTKVATLQSRQRGPADKGPPGNQFLAHSQLLTSLGELWSDHTQSQHAVQFTEHSIDLQDYCSLN